MFVLFVALCVLASANGIPVSVMMNLDLFNSTGGLTDEHKTITQLQTIKSQGADGVMVDVWWGLVETAPKQYNWAGYRRFFEIVRAEGGLDVQVVASFHKCGGNVGDKCNFPLPAFVRNTRIGGPNFWYTSIDGWEDPEYISLGADHEPIFGGRTPVQLYEDFLASFVSEFGDLMPSLINEVQLGLGPAGEMRYPGYPLAHGWQYCGDGDFMVYDDYLQQSLKAAAAKVGQPSWGVAPTDTGGINAKPKSGGDVFFSVGYKSDYGNFFLSWYMGALLQHGHDVMTVAKRTVGRLVPLATKVSGIHWQYLSPSHAAEATAGYYNTNNRNAYASIGTMLKQFNATFDFTCLEMPNPDNGGGCNSAPASLVKQTRLAAKNLNIAYAGENALPVCYPGGCDENGFNQIYFQSTAYGRKIERFTFLRLGDDMLNGNAYNSFKNFVSRMHSA